MAKVTNMKRDVYNILTNPTYVRDCRKSTPHMIALGVYKSLPYIKRDVYNRLPKPIYVRDGRKFSPHSIALGVYMSFFAIHHFTTYDHTWQRFAAVTHTCACSACSRCV